MKRVLASLAAAVLLSGCSTASSAAPDGGRDLVVLAAASLNGTFSQLGEEFEASHPGVRVRFSFDGSASLVDQLAAGAPADVVATADRPTMERATGAGLVAGTPARFASNRLTLIVPAGNPAGVTGLDRSLDGTKLVVCAAGVPCGSATVRLAALSGVTLRPVSEETRVTDVRAKVETGQADAGLVYVTDARVSGDKVEVMAVAGADRAANEYLIGVVSAAGTPLADEFVAFVRGGRGREVLAAAGFAP